MPRSRPGPVITRRVAPSWLLAASLATLAAPLPAAACTHCDSPDAVATRAKVFGAGFWTTLAAVAAPLPLLIAGIALVERFGGGPR